MQIAKEKVRADRFYSIGYIPVIAKYVLVNCVTAGAWYNQYYEISEEAQNITSMLPLATNSTP